MASKECKDDNGAIFDIVEGDVGVRFDGVQVTILGELGYDYSGACFLYKSPETNEIVWDYCRNFTWGDGKVE